MHHNDLLVLLAVWLMAAFTLACIWLTTSEDTLKKRNISYCEVTNVAAAPIRSLLHKSSPVK